MRPGPRQPGASIDRPTRQRPPAGPASRARKTGAGEGRERTSFRARLRAGSFVCGGEEADGQESKSKRRSTRSPIDLEAAPTRSSRSTTAGSASPRPPSCGRNLAEADAVFSVVKNRLAKRAVAEAGTEASSTSCSIGPTALTFVKGDAVVAAKAISTFAASTTCSTYKGGIMDGAPLDPDGFAAIARLPGLDVLHGQLVGRHGQPADRARDRARRSMISGLAVALGQIAEQGLRQPESHAADSRAFERRAERRAASAERRICSGARAGSRRDGRRAKPTTAKRPPSEPAEDEPSSDEQQAASDREPRRNRRGNHPPRNGSRS